jgi:hypothetical protein
MFIKYQHARNGGFLAAIASLVTGVALGGGDAEQSVATVDPIHLSGAASPTPVHAVAAIEPTPVRSSAAEVVAMAATSSGGSEKRKDALGSRSPWKVNLYDDDRNGAWDRLKIDRDRDDTWDAAWTHKDGRWSDGNGGVWLDGRWQTPGAAPVKATATAPPTMTETTVMRTANAASGGVAKRKDVFGASSPWKVNLYDDDKDGTWDRLKLDRDRDDTWDASYVNKSGQWQDGDGNVWREQRWQSPSAAPVTAPSASPADAAALRVAAAMGDRASAKKVKDLTRGSGPKINLYDDDRDGVWDRAKLDVDRDGTWDEKFTRKPAGIERKTDSGTFMLRGEQWTPAAK